MPEIGVYGLKTHVPLSDILDEWGDSGAWDAFWQLVDEISRIEPVDRRPSVEILVEMRW